MGWIDDLLVGLPVNAVLREKLELLGREIAACVAEKTRLGDVNAKLDADQLELKVQVAKLHQLVEEKDQVIRGLKDELHRMSSGPELDEDDLVVLGRVAEQSMKLGASPGILRLTAQRARYHIGKLLSLGLVDSVDVYDDHLISATTEGLSALARRGRI